MHQEGLCFLAMPVRNWSQIFLQEWVFAKGLRPPLGHSCWIGSRLGGRADTLKSNSSQPRGPGSLCFSKELLTPESAWLVLTLKSQFIAIVSQAPYFHHNAGFTESSRPARGFSYIDKGHIIPVRLGNGDRAPPHSCPASAQNTLVMKGLIKPQVGPRFQQDPKLSDSLVWQQ